MTTFSIFLNYSSVVMFYPNKIKVALFLPFFTKFPKPVHEHNQLMEHVSLKIFVILYLDFKFPICIFNSSLLIPF